MQWYWRRYHLFTRFSSLIRIEDKLLTFLALIAVGGWFEERRATAFGVLTTGSGLGGVLFPIIVTRLIRGVGFGWALRISAFIIFFLLAIANLTVKCRSPPTPRPLSRQELIAPFKELDTVLVCVGFMLLTFGIFVPVNYITVQARMAGMSLALSNYLPSIYNGVRLVEPVQELHVTNSNPVFSVDFSRA